MGRCGPYFPARMGSLHLMSPRLRNKLALQGNNSLKRPDPADQAQKFDHGGPPLPRRKALRDLQLEVASYVETLSAELRLLAKAADLGSLAYFLEMARLEASIQIERHATSAAGQQNATGSIGSTDS